MSEIRGVRGTMDKLVRQEREMRPGVPAEQIKREVLGVAQRYDRDVSSGREPPPPLAKQG